MVLIAKLKHVVITSVDRDDLLDGGANHFANCIKEIRSKAPTTTIEVLTPDFRNKIGAPILFLKSGVSTSIVVVGALLLISLMQFAK